MPSIRNRLDQWKKRVQDLKIQTYALYFAYRDSRTPWYARVVVALVVAYAFSPVDLIPDFIPVLGYLDDLILVPLGITLALRLVPAAVWADSLEKAQRLDAQPVNYAGALIVGGIWLAIVLVALQIMGSVMS